MFARSVLITGSNRGIGFEMVKQLATQTEFLFAGCRSVSKDLEKLSNEHKNIVIVQLDVTKQEDIDAAFLKVKDIVQGFGLNCLINNAAVINWELKNIESLTAESLMSMYNINTVGPAMIIKAFLPLLRKASANCENDKMSASRSAIINLTAKTASIVDNSSAKLYGSRLSKVALNMLTKSISIELKNDKIISVAINPGWVKTDAGGENALITTEESVSKMLKILSAMDDESTGKFLSYDNQIIPW